jgi:hypothetical protein
MMENFDDWWDDERAYDVSGGDWDDLKAFVRSAYKAGKQSQQTELQNRITELEEIISGRQDSKGSGLGL